MEHDVKMTSVLAGIKTKPQRILGILNEPFYSFDEEGAKGCLKRTGDTVTYFINRRCKTWLLWHCWHCAESSSDYEDPNLINRYYPALTTEAAWINYCETIVLRDEDAADRDRRHPLGFLASDERLDFYVTRSEFVEAFRRIQRLTRTPGKKQVTQITIFKSLRVVLLNNAAFYNDDKASHADKTSSNDQSRK